MDKQLRAHAALSAPALLTSLSHEAAADFVLPEYMPPIRRVVSVEASPLPESRFLSGAALELGGTLALSILYIGEDSALSCAAVTAEYNASCAVGEAQIPDASRVGVDTVAENVTCRVTAPRAFTIRARMRTHLILLHDCPLEEHITDAGGGRATPADEIAMERLTKTAQDVTLSRGEGTFTAAGTLAVAPETKIIRAHGAVRIEEARAADGAVNVRGEVLLHALCLTPDGRFTTADARAPISETVSVPDAADGDAARAWGRAASVTLQPGEKDFSWEIEYDLEAEAAHAGEQPYTADAYSTACAAEVTTEEAESLSLLRCGVSALTVSGEGGRQSKPQAGETVIDTRATAVMDHIEAREGQLILHGIAAAAVLIAADGDLVSEEFTLPFRCEMKGTGADPTDLIARSVVEVISASARPDGDKLAVNLELCISTLALGREKIRAVKAVTLDRAAPHRRRDGVIRICYPDPGEPLWEIAKRYAVKRSSLGEAEIADGAPMIV